MLCSTAPVPGSSSQEYNLAFEIPPPSSVRPGSQFTIPVVVSVRPASNQRPNPVQQLAVHASLRNENHAPATGLIGPLTSSVRSRSGNTTAGYASFNPLRITQPGRYRLRVMLAAASYSGVMTKEYVDSGVIHVDPGAEAEQRPSTSEF